MRPPLPGELGIVVEQGQQIGVGRSNLTWRLSTPEFPVAIPPGDLFPLGQGVSADAKFGSNLSLRPVSLFPDAFPARRAGQWSRVPTRSLPLGGTHHGVGRRLVQGVEVEEGEVTIVPDESAC